MSQKSNPPTDVPIKDAATIVLLRDDRGDPEVLMGQRGAKAAFMPDKFVFPGGGVDKADFAMPAGFGDDLATKAALEAHSEPIADALVNAAIRELWEETGLILGASGKLDIDPPEEWAGYVGAGFVPSASALQFFFRAITPPGRPRRFDARFFMARAEAIQGDIEDFSDASGELSHLQWIPLRDVRNFSLPFITEIVLSEVQDMIHAPDAPRSIPFFCHDAKGASFRSIVADCS